MKILFVGGPMHGQEIDYAEIEDMMRFTVPVEGSKDIEYERRTWAWSDGKSVDFFAPCGMPSDQVTTLGFPLMDKVRFALGGGGDNVVIN